MAAIHRLSAYQTLMQMTAQRAAAWGDGDAVARFRAALLGEDAPGSDETAAALAAFGLRGTA